MVFSSMIPIVLVVVSRIMLLYFGFGFDGRRRVPTSMVLEHELEGATRRSIIANSLETIVTMCRRAIGTSVVCFQLSHERSGDVVNTRSEKMCT